MGIICLVTGETNNKQMVTYTQSGFEWSQTGPKLRGKRDEKFVFPRTCVCVS